MPWSRTNPGKERVELCREFGISRETGYVWLRRYRAAGHKVEAIEERSHRPFAAATGPNAVWCVDFKGWFRTVDGRPGHGERPADL